MARKKYQDEEESQDRWIVSYADFITLLFAFFVVMYALSSVNEGKYRILSDSILNAFGKSPAAPVINLDQPGGAALQPGIAPPVKQQRKTEAVRQERELMTGIARDIRMLMEPLVNQGKVRVTQTPRGVNIEINASVLFAPGDAQLNAGSIEALKAVARVLKEVDNAVRVEGHTDSVPIHTVQFPSNWELSAVRASSVVRLFIENGVEEARLTVAGHGPTQPVAANDTSEGKTRNRRVEVIVLSNLAEEVREVPLGP